MISACFLAACGSADEPALPALVGAVVFDGTAFEIENKDAFAWTDCTADVNFQMSGSYAATFQEVGAGHHKTIAAASFAKDDGERFNTYTHKVQSLYVSCHTPSGKQSASWTFDTP